MTAIFTPQTSTGELCRLWQMHYPLSLHGEGREEEARIVKAIEDELQRRHPKTFAEWKAAEGDYSAYRDPARFFHWTFIE